MLDLLMRLDNMRELLLHTADTRPAVFEAKRLFYDRSVSVGPLHLSQCVHNHPERQKVSTSCLLEGKTVDAYNDVVHTAFFVHAGSLQVLQNLQLGMLHGGFEHFTQRMVRLFFVCLPIVMLKTPLSAGSLCGANSSHFKQRMGRPDLVTQLSR